MSMVCSLQMCVPLVLLDKLPLAEAYVKGRLELQDRLVTTLDSWCSPQFSLDQLRRYTHTQSQSFPTFEQLVEFLIKK